MGKMMETITSLCEKYRHSDKTSLVEFLESLTTAEAMMLLSLLNETLGERSLNKNADNFN